MEISFRNGWFNYLWWRLLETSTKTASFNCFNVKYFYRCCVVGACRLEISETTTRKTPLSAGCVKWSPWIRAAWSEISFTSAMLWHRGPILKTTWKICSSRFCLSFVCVFVFCIFFSTNCLFRLCRSCTVSKPKSEKKIGRDSVTSFHLSSVLVSEICIIFKLKQKVL